MEFYDVVDSRRTTREFSEFEVSDDVIKRIIGAGMKAPSNDHMRDWEFVIIKDKRVVTKLLDLVPKSFSKDDIENLFISWNLTDKTQQDMYSIAVPKQYRMLYDASVIIVPLLKEKAPILNAKSVSSLNGFASIWCAVENILLAATNEGLGVSLRIPLGNEDKHAKEVLGIPDEYFMPCFLGIGKRSEDASVIKQKPIIVEDHIHFNRW